MSEEIKVGDYLIKKDLLYTKTDEWVKVEGNIAIVGITDYAQKKLKYVVGVELPEVGTEVSKEERVAVLESVKTVADIYVPCSGKIVEVNEELMDHPEYINQDPYGKGWILKIEVKDPNELKDLLKPEEYAEKIKKEEGL
ncbi:MAG: glycine cleavage system protein GcvH [Thermoprotei archaeon]|nr:MAG: glycine cleavage system protein GcvH [Thermoprotei archaeon]